MVVGATVVVAVGGAGVGGGAAVVVGSAVVAGAASGVVGGAVIAGVAVSEPPPHPEATSRTTMRILRRVMVPV